MAAAAASFLKFNPSLLPHSHSSAHPIHNTAILLLLFSNKIKNEKRKFERLLPPPLKAAQSEGFTRDGEEPHNLSKSSAARTQLELLEQLTSISPSSSGYESDGRRPTIREQLSEFFGDRGGDFTILLGKSLKASVNSLTISQKRNIKRQAYLDKVSQRNDTTFFATIGAFVILPPLLILAIAILTGYVKLFP